MGSASPDPLDAGLATSDPPGKGSASSNPGGARSVPPDALDRIPPRPTRGCGVSLGRGHGLPRGPPPPPTATNTGCGPGTMPQTLGRGRTRLNVTGGRHRLYLGTHISNGAGRTSTVLLDPRATPDNGIC
jgi:hypothetical protein